MFCLFIYSRGRWVIFIVRTMANNKLTRTLEILEIHRTFSCGKFIIWAKKQTLIFLQKYGPLESEWDSAQKIVDYLFKFQGFANKVLKH